MTDVSDKFIYDIEVGNKGMSAETLFKLAFALGLSIDVLLKEMNKKEIFQAAQ
ncbi:MAG: helix-turn-helix domain-containing protein [Oscillospiraceae bacterium]|nr:helix-turn-helix domain-containing protein [Oscillospiraceae bacterium]